MRDNIVNPLTDFGATVKMELYKKGKTQNWLILRLREICPDMYIDSSVVNKVLTGRTKTGKIVEATKKILELD